MNDIDNNCHWQGATPSEHAGAIPFRLRLDQVACRDHDDMMAEMVEVRGRRRDDDYYEPRRHSPKRRSFRYVDQRGRSYALVRQSEGDAERAKREKTFFEGMGNVAAGVGGLAVGAGGVALLVTGAANFMHRAPRPGLALLAAGAALVAVGWTLLSAVWGKH